MMNPICTFSFNISAWNVVANKALSVEDWQQGEAFWQANAERWETVSPKLAFLPPLKRRRLSDAARLFFESAWELTADKENLPVVYASQNSEINRSFTLWESLLKEGDVSPTSFSLSVHNALVGQWSEMRRVKAETTAIAAQQDNLETALLEAYLLLNDGHQKVLVVVAEDPLAKAYNAEPVYRQPFAYALALVVEQGSQYQLELHAQAVENSEKFTNGDNALIFVQQQHLGSQEWQTSASRGGVWRWVKN
ncbi:beta-ketoacyl synthase chain length factor [Bibersteinia trehalosi]|nr:beta-ketoacyl synthase chain length factor [Bibersteinia trehalosi]